MPEGEGKLIFPTPLSPSKTIDVSVEQKIRKIKEVTIQEVLLIMNWEASYRPVVDSKLVENFLTALPLKKKL